VLSLEADDPERFRFPDDLWARVVYDFALGHHWSVVYRDHLLRSLVPLYLGRTAAFVLATRRRDAAAVESAPDRRRRGVRAGEALSGGPLADDAEQRAGLVQGRRLLRGFTSRPTRTPTATASVTSRG